MKSLIPCLLSLMLVVLPAAAQTITLPTADYAPISGRVKDRHTRRVLENVNIQLQGTSIGTVTNADGRFTLKIPLDAERPTLLLSHLGYQTLQLPATGLAPGSDLLLTPQSLQLAEVVVQPIDAQQVVTEAVSRLSANYYPHRSMSTTFYRETVRKRRKYITVSEAVAQLYKEEYRSNLQRDRVRLLKGRRLVSPRSGDTLAVKLEGGPTLALEMDLAKNPGVVLSPDYLLFYRYQLTDYVLIDDRLCYAIHFEPRVRLPEEPLYSGTLYIDCQELSFSRIAFSLDLSDRDLVTRLILRRKPAGLRFRPQELSYLVTYRRDGQGGSYLHYVRAEIRFHCDWRRRLFSTGYTLVSEMVCTDRLLSPTETISSRQAFRSSQVLSDQAAMGYDPAFWQQFNIIEPTQSLEEAASRLRVAPGLQPQHR